MKRLWSLTNDNQGNQSCTFQSLTLLYTLEMHPKFTSCNITRRRVLLSPAIILDSRDLSDKIPCCFWHGNLFVFPKRGFLFAVIGVFLHSYSETAFFSLILGLWVIFVIMFVGHFPDLCCFVFQAQLTPFLLLQTTSTSQKGRSFPFPLLS